MNYAEKVRVVEIDGEVYEIDLEDEKACYKENSIQQDLYEIALWQRDINIESQNYEMIK